MFIRLLSLVLLLFLSLGVGVQSVAIAQANQANQANNDDSESVDAVVRKKRAEPQYYDVNMNTLSQLYWKMGNYDPSNDVDIDNFLMINRCDIYKKYYRDDFEWHRIRSKAQNTIEDSYDRFPDRFEIVQSLNVGRYDIRGGFFPIVTPVKTKRFEIKADDPIECQKYIRRGIFKYPSAAIVEFSTRLDFWQIPANEELAKLYNDLYRNWGLYTNRPVYYVIKFKVFEAKAVTGNNLLRNKNGHIKAVAERIDFYGDEALKLHMYAMDFRKSNDSFRSGAGLE